jgi:hypothetical protein
VLLSPEAINLDEANRAKLQAIANAEPLALIEYWAVDPDYDGKVFRSVWQDYRGNTDNDGDPLRVITQANFTTCRPSGPRRVCVRVVDVFGFEAEVVHPVAAAGDEHRSKDQAWPAACGPDRQNPATVPGPGRRRCRPADLVTPTTAELLRGGLAKTWCQTRSGLNFHPGQKQAILNAIVAHEVLGARRRLQDLVPAGGARCAAGGQPAGRGVAAKHAHPKYCFKMATGTGKTWVLQALLIWQLLNKNAALAEGLDDARFTRQFMVVAPGLIVYERLLDAFCGKLIAGSASGGKRDFATPTCGAVCRPVHPRSAPRNGVCLCARQRVRQGRDRPEGHRQRHDRHHQLAFAGRGG